MQNDQSSTAFLMIWISLFFMTLSPGIHSGCLVIQLGSLPSRSFMVSCAFLMLGFQPLPFTPKKKQKTKNKNLERLGIQGLQWVLAESMTMVFDCLILKKMPISFLFGTDEGNNVDLHNFYIRQPKWEVVMQIIWPDISYVATCSIWYAAHSQRDALLCCMLEPLLQSLIMSIFSILL